VNRSTFAVAVSAALALGPLATGQGVATSSTSMARTISPMVTATPNGSWSAVGGSPDGPVYALTTSPSGVLYVGGDFDAIGSRTLSNIARWQDDTYSALGAGLDDTVRALAWDDTLYVGGQFTSEAGGIPLARIAAWKDDTYRPLGAGIGSGSVRVILPTDDTIYVGGEFDSASGVLGTRRLAGWIDDTWVTVGGGVADCRPPAAERVTAIAMLPADRLVVSGKFRCTEVATADDSNISLWTGSQWNNMDGGLNPGPGNSGAGEIGAALVADGETLYVAGEFISAGTSVSPPSFGSMATWRSGTWSRIGSGVDGLCGAANNIADVATLSLDAERGLLYAGGAFCRAGDDTVNSIVVRDLAVNEWVPLIAPGPVVGLTRDDTSHRVQTILHDDSVVYVGGNFTTVGGISGLNNLARWTWQPPTGSNDVTAPPGAAVSLSGSRFIGVPTSGGVYFGGVPAPSYIRVSTTSFGDVVVPAGISGTVAIEVDAVGGRAVVGTLTVPLPEPSSPPRDVIAVAGDASASVSWAAPATSGSFAVSTYQATSSPGGRTCLVTAPALSCEVTGLTNGTPYTFTVRALTGAGWSPSSVPSNAVTPAAAPRPSVVITGSREGKRITITGETTGFSMGGILRPWLRFPGQSAHRQGSATILVSADGTFEWGRRTVKRVSVYVQTPDGSVRSNTVTIQAR